MQRQVVRQRKRLGQSKDLRRKPVDVLKTDPVVATLTQGRDQLLPIPKVPIDRGCVRDFKADRGGVEGPQYLGFDNIRHQDLQVGDVALYASAQIVGDYQ